MGTNAKDLGLDKLPTEDKVALINELWVDDVAEERSHPIPTELAQLLDSELRSTKPTPNSFTQ